MELTNILGCLASILVFAAFYVKHILILRFIAISSNIAFIAYASTAHLIPIFILHSFLLPLNIRRIVEIKKNFAVQPQINSQMREKISRLGPLHEGRFIFRQGQDAWEVHFVKATAISYYHKGDAKAQANH